MFLVEEAAEQNHLYLSSTYTGHPQPTAYTTGHLQPNAYTIGHPQPTAHNMWGWRARISGCPNWSLNQKRQLDRILAPLPQTIVSSDTI